MKHTGHKRTFDFFLIAIIFLLLLNCSQDSQRLVTKKYTEGFSLKQPENWQAQVLDKTYIWISSKESEESPFILVYPFFLKKVTQSTSWLQKQLPALSKFFAAVGVGRVEQIRRQPDEAVAKFRFKKNNIPCQGLALCSIHQRSGILYIMAAPMDVFEEYRGQLLDILESFRFESPKKTKQKMAARPKIRYRTWQDPQEQAFNMEVPTGWAINGGTFRRASVDLIHVLQAVSPDQKILVQFNDSNIPVFVMPSPILTMSGFREGSWYSPGYGVRMMVKRYTPGVHFINEYLNSQYRPRLAQFQIVSQKERPDIVSSFNKIYSQYMTYGISFTLHAGEAAFRFEQDSQPFVGYGLALTQIVQSTSMQGGNWSLALMIIYSCPASETDTVRQIADHMFHSVKMNPHWVASQQQLAANVSQIVTQTNQEISRIIDESYWSRQKTLDNTHRRFSNYILGMTDVVDPETGENWKVEAGHNYYWRKDYTDQIIGNEVYTRPDIDFSPLKEF